jgi:hypothetical protein
MFCNACGKELPIGHEFCSACGQPVGVAPIPRSINRVSHHIQILGILWIVYSLFDLMGAIAVTAVPGIVLGIASNVEGANIDPSVRQILMPLFVILGILLMVKSLLGIAAGAGLLQRTPWARVLAIILGIIALLSVPLGTALGVYTLWTLLSPESLKEYESMARR